MQHLTVHLSGDGSGDGSGIFVTGDRVPDSWCQHTASPVYRFSRYMHMANGLIYGNFHPKFFVN